ncbi:MAG TPA: succinylglutamate desuccinylase/aspartoacylase family protein [Thermomicrobiales bacterium]|nr:succinylglutamate desuccinylase/aspartoacylase family protein [Thermomicrobiales bacterium]
MTAQRETFPIGATTLDDFRPGSKLCGWLEVAPGLSWPVQLPLLVARGVSSGPTVMAVAGVHGDEYEGMEAIRAVFATLDPARMSGTFIGIPVANPFAYDARARVAPLFVDGLNLARIFPGNPNGTPSAVLAHELFTFITRNLGADDLFIDFHSGSADAAYATIVGVRAQDGPIRAVSEEAARHFGLTDLWEVPDSRGPLNAETTRAGIPTIGTETIGRAGFHHPGFDAYATGLRNLLAFRGITDDPMPAPVSGPFRPTRDVLSPGTGFLRTKTTLYDDVVGGQRLGTIVDLFGDPIEEVIAPATGTIWAAREMRAVRSGEVLFYVALDGAR